MGRSQSHPPISVPLWMSCAKRYRVDVRSISHPIHYIPREIIRIIESYVPLEDLSDSDQAQRVRRIAWSTSSHWQVEGQCTTAFEHHNSIYYIIHQGNWILRIDERLRQCIYLYSPRIRQHGTAEEICISYRFRHWDSDTSSGLELASCRLLNVKNPPFTEECRRPPSKFLYERAQWIMQHSQYLLRMAEIIVSHLHPFDKYKWRTFSN